MRGFRIRVRYRVTLFGAELDQQHKGTLNHEDSSEFLRPCYSLGPSSHKGSHKSSQPTLLTMGNRFKLHIVDPGHPTDFITEFQRRLVDSLGQLKLPFSVTKIVGQHGRGVAGSLPSGSGNLDAYLGRQLLPLVHPPSWLVLNKCSVKTFFYLILGST